MPSRTWPAALALLLALAACAHGPEPRLATLPAEASHAVTPLGPGRWYLLVRGATFATRSATEAQLARRAAALCPGGRPRLHRRSWVERPPMASAEVTCDPPPPAPAPPPPA